MQFDVAEELEVEEEDREYGALDSFEEREHANDSDTEGGYQVARRSLASIFGEAEVVEVDEAQADESLLVSTSPPACGIYELTAFDLVCLHLNAACHAQYASRSIDSRVRPADLYREQGPCS